jgi:NADPH2:quinone reductase
MTSSAGPQGDVALANRLEQVRGVVVERLGNWREAKVGTLPLKSLQPGEILIECEAAALNFHDLLLIDGKYQIKPAPPFFPGSDVVGRVIAAGPGAKRFAIGQRVAAVLLIGAFAELAIAPENRCFAIPDDIDAATAAACGTVFATVAVALTIRGNLQRGERLLVTGAAGGVGVAAIQYARMIGAEVIALVSSDAKEKMVRRAGAHYVLRLDELTDPKTELRDALLREAGNYVDVVLDVVGGDVFDGAVRCIKEGGRLLVVGFASGRIAEIKSSYLLLKDLTVIGSALDKGFQRSGPLLSEIMDRIYKAVSAGECDSFVSERFSLEHFSEAAQRIADRSVVGKIALLPKGGA